MVNDLIWARVVGSRGTKRSWQSRERNGRREVTDRRSEYFGTTLNLNLRTRRRIIILN